MIPTLLVAGLLLGLVSALRLRYKAMASAALAVVWAAYVAIGLHASLTYVVIGFVLAVINTAIGVVIGMGVAALVRAMRPSRSIGGLR